VSQATVLRFRVPRFRVRRFLVPVRGSPSQGGRTRRR